MVISRTISGRLAISILAALAASMMGCESTPHFDENFGLATNANKQRMIADPEAGTSPDDGVIEIEGATVETSLKRYRRQQTSTSKTSMPRSILSQGASSSR